MDDALREELERKALRYLELENESLMLYRRFLLTRKFDDIDQALSSIRESHALLTDISPYVVNIETESGARPEVKHVQKWILLHLGRTLLRRFQHTGQIGNLTDAISMLERTFHSMSDDWPLRKKCFAYLGISYLERDGNLDALHKLDTTYALTEPTPSVNALQECLGDSEVKEVILYFRSALSKRATPRVIKGQELDTDIQLCRDFLVFLSASTDSGSGHTRSHTRGHTLIILSKSLRGRFVLHGKLNDINEAVDCSLVGVELLSPYRVDTPPILSRGLSYASEACLSRFKALGKQEDLHRAARLAEEAMEVIETEVPDYEKCPEFVLAMRNRADAMRAWYRATGGVKKLDTAIDIASRAVDIADRNEDFPLVLESFIGSIACRFIRSGRAEDLMQMVAATRSAIDPWLPNDPKLIMFLPNLATQECYLYVILRDEEYLDQAKRHILQAWQISDDHGFHPENDLALINATFMVLVGDISDTRGCFARTMGNRIEAVMEIARNNGFADGSSLEHSNERLWGTINILANWFLRRWMSTKTLRDIDEVIRLARRNVEVTKGFPTDSSWSSDARLFLGSALYFRYTSTADKDNRDEALSILFEMSRMPSRAPWSRIDAGVWTLEILSDIADWDNARKLIPEIIDLFTGLNGRSQAWRVKQYWLRFLFNRSANFISIVLESGSSVLDAIGMLEACRGSMLGHLIDRRTELNDLEEAAPDKAERFRTLQGELNFVTDSELEALETLQDEITTNFNISTKVNTRVQRTERRIKIEEEFRLCLEEIRMLKGFDRFLLGPTVDEIHAAAALGPIVIVNVSNLRSDAIIITKDDLILLQLPGLKHKEVIGYAALNLTNFTFKDIGKKNRGFRKLQTWLWDSCVKHVFERLEELGYGPEKFHIWWIGVGAGNHLPFHAAGKYEGNFRETSLARAISSYTPTLKALVHGRRKLKDDFLQLGKQPLSNMQQRMTVITMPSTPGNSDLSGVEREAEEIQKSAGHTFPINVLVQPRSNEVMAHMANSEIVHFACHGESTAPDVSSCHLLLQATLPDTTVPAIDKLKLSDVATADLRHGKLAFLSACSTAAAWFLNFLTRCFIWCLDSMLLATCMLSGISGYRMMRRVSSL